MSQQKRLVLRELAKRQQALEAEALKPKFIIEEFCFDKQIRFINDPAKFKTAVCSRRSGKTVSCAADLVNTCLNFPGVNCAYITITRGTAKRIIWKDLISIIKKFDLKVQIDKQDLTFTFSNGSVLYISGADDEGEIEKYRGMKFKKVYIDEVQSFRSYIAELVNDVIVPSLYDLDGSLVLIGTPGPVPAGFFYDITQNKDWSHHHWTIYDNPFIKVQSGKDPVQIVEQANKVRGIDETHPTHMRENMGLWVKDENALVFQVSEQRNITKDIPNQDMTYIMGVDIGWSDADAIAVLGYNSTDKNVYLVEEYVQSKQNISQLVSEITYFKDKYNPVRMVMDAGALGKKIQEEIRQRHGIHMEAAEKHRKIEFIELLNDDLRTAKVKILKDSRFYEDSFKVQWDRSNPHKPRISDIYHTDIGDAVLYSWRECKHYLSEHPEQKTKPGTDKYMKELEEKEAEEMELRKRKDNFDALAASQEDMDDLFDSITDVYND
jgi:phage terminase large subunit